MMTTLICTECSEPKVITDRSVVLPYVCEECQKAPELLEAMAPAPLKIEESDNIACDCTPTDEATSLLIEDLSNQLAITKNEAETLRNLATFLEARENSLMLQNKSLQEKVEKLALQNQELGIKGFYASLRELALWAAGSELDRRFQSLKKEFEFAARRVFSLAAELGKAYQQRDVWQKRAEIAKRAYDRASADRRYYRDKCRDAGIKA